MVMSHWKINSKKIRKSAMTSAKSGVYGTRARD